MASHEFGIRCSCVQLLRDCRISVARILSVSSQYFQNLCMSRKRIYLCLSSTSRTFVSCVPSKRIYLCQSSTRRNFVCPARVYSVLPETLCVQQENLSVSIQYFQKLCVSSKIIYLCLSVQQEKQELWSIFPQTLCISLSVYCFCVRWVFCWECYVPLFILVSLPDPWMYNHRLPSTCQSSSQVWLLQLLGRVWPPPATEPMNTLQLPSANWKRDLRSRTPLWPSELPTCPSILCS